ncbi:MAG: FtsH protease activity modulator HflK [Sulfuricellaceae bacterium]|nr:FtsH protease activity modulator HflK [Sulfuricellaceae bacterium]
MAWNDPDWGNKNSGGNRNVGGPPDLDELWRKVNDKLGGMFGGKGGNGGGMPSAGQAFGGMGVVAAIALLVWIGSGFYIVNAGERGVVMRFGKYVETTEPGPRWHMPFPVESAKIVNMEQVRTVEVGYRNSVKTKVLKESLMLTDDENIIDIQFAVQYTLKDPKAYLFNNRDPDASVLQSAETAIREIVGKSKMDFVINEGRAEVAAKASKLMQEILDHYQTGIIISKVTMQNAQPPEQVQASFDDAVKAGQDKERQKNEGQAYANDVIPKARGTASRLLLEAEGYKQRVETSAIGDAARFEQIVAEYNKSPAVTRDRLYLDAMQQIYSSTSKVLVDQKGGNSMLYLPLDKIIQQSAEHANAPKPVAAPEPTPSVDTSRSREAFRSRERETRP